MFMPCPHCGYVVALIASSTGTEQRCPRCEGALHVAPPDSATQRDAVDSAKPGPPAGDSGTGPATIDASPPISTDESATPDRPPAEAKPVARGGDSTVPAAGEALPSASRGGRSRRTPSFVRGNTAAPRRRIAWPWYAASFALALVLVLQLLLAQRHELAADGRWRPALERVCGALSCELRPWREPQAFTMLQRSVQPSPSTPGALAVEANFRNDARWPQPWPTLLLSLSDVEGRQVGARAFAPVEYRKAGAHADALLAPGQTATVRLQLREPTPRVVAFTFDFL